MENICIINEFAVPNDEKKNVYIHFTALSVYLACYLICLATLVLK